MADLLAGGEGGELLAAILLVVDLAGHVLQVLHITVVREWQGCCSADMFADDGMMMIKTTTILRLL